MEEEPVEAWFPVRPPDRISLPERDSVFTNSAGRQPQVGGIVAASTLTHRQDAACSRHLARDRGCPNVPPTANLFRFAPNDMPLVQILSRPHLNPSALKQCGKVTPSVHHSDDLDGMDRTVISVGPCLVEVDQHPGGSKYLRVTLA